MRVYVCAFLVRLIKFTFPPANMVIERKQSIHAELGRKKRGRLQ